MALFKRLMEVIKEELFDSKPETTPEKTPSVTSVGEVRKKTSTVVTPRAENTKVAVKKQQTAKPAPQKRQQSSKPAGQKNQPQKKPASQKNQQTVKTAVKLEKLPDEALSVYGLAKAALQKGNFDVAFESYQKAFGLMLEFVCNEMGVDYNGQTQKWMLRKACGGMRINSKTGSKLHTLLAAIQGNVEFADKKKRVQRIGKDMELFVSCIQSGTINVEKAAKKKPQPKTAAKKTANTRRLSFKARENVIKGDPFDINKEYPKVKMYLDSAKDNQEEKKFYGALHDIRMALEVIVKALARKLSVYFDENDDLEDKIIKLAKSDKLSKGQSDVLHSARRLGNKGSHDNDKWTPGEGDVTKAFAEIKTVIDMFVTFMTDDRGTKNAPVLGSNEYYSPQRKYYGRWTHCFNYASLMMIDDYVMLKEKADKGNIQAMLDIASGFLENPISWTGDSLIFLKKYQGNPDPCDARYYYWTLKACYTAYEAWKAGKPLPLRYLANALLEGIKFIYSHEKRYSGLSSREIVVKNNDQFSKSKDLFGSWGYSLLWQDEYIEMLTAMMKEYQGKNLFANVHKEKTVQDIEQWRKSRR